MTVLLNIKRPTKSAGPAATPYWPKAKTIRPSRIPKLLIVIGSKRKMNRVMLIQASVINAAVSPTALMAKENPMMLTAKMAAEKDRI